MNEPIDGLFSADEVALEREMADLGIERYRASARDLGTAGLVASTAPGRYLLRESMSRMVGALEAWRKEGREPARAYELLGLLDLKVSSFVAGSVILDLAATQPTLTRLALSVGARIEDEVAFRATSRSDPELWTRLRRCFSRVSVGRRRKSIRDRIGPVDRWDRLERLRVGLVLVEAAMAAGLVEEVRTTDMGRKARVSVTIPDKVLRWMERSHDAHATMRPFYLPMVDVPLPWQGIEGGGYRTSMLAKRPLVRASGAHQARALAEVPMPEVYGAVNRLQDCRWEVNEDVAQVLDCLWDSGSVSAGLPVREDIPMPVYGEKRVSRADRLAGLIPEAEKRWMVECGKLRSRNAAERAERIRVSRTRFVAEKMRERPFYFPHYLDFRGRAYPLPNFLSPQGDDLARGLLRFHEARILDRGSPAEEWFRVHGANCWGEDKVPIADRVAWVDEHADQITAVYEDPLACDWWAGADRPWEFLAWAMECGELLNTGRVLTRVPVHLDGTNNGLQIFSLLMRDEGMARATNCLPGDRPQDLYRDVADDATLALAAVAAAGCGRCDLSHRPAPGQEATTCRGCIAAGWLRWLPGGRIPRDCAKRPVMTLPYGATLYACQRYVTFWFIDQLESGGRTSPFSREDYCWRECALLAGIIWDSIEGRLGPAVRCMEWLRECADRLFDRGDTIRWTAPSGFPVEQRYTSYRSTSIRTVLGDKIRWTRLRRDGGTLSRRRQMNGIAPNYVHSLDAAVLAGVGHRWTGALTTVHDSYGCHADRADRLVALIRGQYAEMFSRDLLGDLKRELELSSPGLSLPEAPERGTLDVTAVLGARYLFS